MIKSGNPVRDAERFAEEQDEMMKQYMKGCPWCVSCDEPITDPKCYVLDPDDKMNTCICKDCMDSILSQMKRAKINAAVMDWITQQLEYGDGEGFEKVTPHKEDEYGF